MAKALAILDTPETIGAWVKSGDVPPAPASTVPVVATDIGGYREPKIIRQMVDEFDRITNPEPSQAPTGAPTTQTILHTGHEPPHRPPSIVASGATDTPTDTVGSGSAPSGAPSGSYDNAQGGSIQQPSTNPPTVPRTPQAVEPATDAGFLAGGDDMRIVMYLAVALGGALVLRSFIGGR